MSCPTFELTNAESEELQNLRDALAALEKEIQERLARHITGEQMNPVSDIGGIRSRSKRQKRQIFERYTRQAREHLALKNRKGEIERRIQWLEAKPERERKRWQRDVATLLWWDNLKKGDVISLGNGNLVIEKKNRMSIVLGGVRWSIQEITGLSRDRIKQIRNCQKSHSPQNPPGYKARG